MGATIEQVLAHATTLIAAKKAFDDSIIDYGDDLIAQKEAEKEATESAPVLPAPRREAPKRKAPVARKVAVATRRKAPLALPSPGPERTPKQRAAGREGGGASAKGVNAVRLGMPPHEIRKKFDCDDAEISAARAQVREESGAALRCCCGNDYGHRGRCAPLPGED